MSPVLGRARHLPSLVIGLALLAPLAACSGGDSDPQPGATAGDPGGTPTAQVPSGLPDGVLEVTSRTRAVDLDGDVRRVTDPAWTEEWIAWVSAPDDVLHLVERESGDQRWQAELPADRENGTGACRAPVPASEETLLVFTGYFCDRLLAYDLSTGELTVEHPFVKEVSGVELGTQVTTLTVVEGRVWFGTFDVIGYVDEQGRPHDVLATEALGPVLPGKDRMALNRLTSIPGTDTLVAGRLHSSDGASIDSKLDYTGLDVSDPDHPEVVWSFSELARPADAEVLGLDNLRRNAPIDVLEEPAAITLAGLAGGKVAVGLPDPATGRLEHHAVLPGWRSSLFEASAEDDENPVALDGTTLYAASDPKAGYGYGEVEAWDLATGQLLWRTPVAAPEGVSDPDDVTVKDFTVGDDGDLYLVATDSFRRSEVQRLEAGSGEATGSWPLPEWLARDYEIRVIGDQVWASPGRLLGRGVGTVVMEVVDADEALARVAPAAGALWTTKPLTLRLAKGLDWTGPEVTDEPVLWQDARYGSLEGFRQLSITVSVLPGIEAEPEEYLEVALDVTRDAWGTVELVEPRELDGVTVQHVVARDPKQSGQGEVQHTWLVERPEGWAELTVGLPDELPGTLQLLESMLLTVRWR